MKESSPPSITLSSGIPNHLFPKSRLILSLNHSKRKKTNQSLLLNAHIQHKIQKMNHNKQLHGVAIQEEDIYGITLIQDQDLDIIVWQEKTRRFNRTQFQISNQLNP